MSEEDVIKLKIDKIVNYQILSTELLRENFDIDVSFNALFENDATMIRAIYRLATYEELLGQYPADWWQAFKERWFPDWLLRRYPVQWTKLVAKHKFPHCPITTLGNEYIEVIRQKPEVES